jgi:4-hydroxybenzoate polyprenyltransferase
VELLLPKFGNTLILAGASFFLAVVGGVTVGVLAASRLQPITPRTIVLVIVAFSAARWAAMGFNRVADLRFDAVNPRTRNRELPRGALSLAQAWASIVLAMLVFLGAAWALNPLCFLLSPLALGWILAYSLAKRFTWWPHLWLGVSLAIAPVGGYLAVTGRWSHPAWLLLAVSVAVATWVAGFDIFYALPDAGFDLNQGLKSAVVRLGERRAIILAKLLHGITIPALALFGLGAGFGAWYFAGLLVATGILAYEHRLVHPGDLTRLDAAFFTLNGVMSVTVFGFALIDRVWG